MDEKKEQLGGLPSNLHDKDNITSSEMVYSSSGSLCRTQQHGSPPKLFPCAFYSRKLTPAEQNYDVGNRELLAMKSALEEWRHWLEGSKHPFVILTDHKTLEYL
ncbi:Transposon Tf2-8 polyprotein [Labeo rohita]|uniref:Transposon Tf2-8 polyprotein n=1 Tax=Labeo rohita TaxID=84645 RepID=A0ABQ8MXE5_LABRO|nr:Transposon Tf2-8 polyprotein [Labeo rohita]